MRNSAPDPTSAPNSDTTSRAAPPFTKHDWYTLTRLHRNLQRAARRHLRHRNGQSVLDFGAGNSPYEPLFTRRGLRYVAGDIDDSAPVRIVPGEPLPLADHSMGVVASFQVLEHVWDLDWYLGECRRVLREDGLLLLSTHGVWLYHPHPTDFRRWTRDGLERELTSRGFEIVEVYPLVGPLAWTTQFRALGYHALLSRVPGIGQSLSGVVCALLNARMLLEDALTPRALKAVNAAVYLMVARPASPPQSPP